MKNQEDHIDVKYEVDFDRLIELTIDIGNKLEKQAIPEGESFAYIEGFGQKIIRHILTAKLISDGYRLNIGNKLYEPMTDFSSAMVITRAALETYLTFHFLFVDPKEDDKKRFRFLCWHISGFLDRAEHEPEFDTHKELKKKEAELLVAYQEELKTNTYFITSTPEAQKRALKGEWKIFDGWSKLAVNAGFQEVFFRQQYRLLCSYSHSGRLSIMQIQQSKSVELQNQMARASRAVLILVIAKFIYDYIEIWPLLHDTKKEQRYDLITFWKYIAETMNQPEDDNTNPGAEPE